MLPGDVHHRQLAAPMRGLDHRLYGRQIERVEAAAQRPVVEHDLDVVGALVDTCLHESIGLLGRGEGRDLEPVFGAVAARRGHQVSSREQVGAVQSFTTFLLRLQSGRRIGQREHVQLGRNPHDQRRLEHRTEDVHVRVDQTGQQGGTRTVNDFGGGRRCDLPADRGDLPLLHQHLGRLDHGVAVEHTHVPEQGRFRHRGLARASLLSHRDAAQPHPPAGASQQIGRRQHEEYQADQCTETEQCPLARRFRFAHADPSVPCSALTAPRAPRRSLAPGRFRAPTRCRRPCHRRSPPPQPAPAPPPEVRPRG